MRTILLAVMTSASALTFTIAASAQTMVRSAVTPGMVVGGRVAMLGVDEISNPVVSIGAFTDVPLTNNLLAGASIDYWRDSSGLDYPRTETSDIALAANGKFVFTHVESEFRPYVGAGMAIHRVSDEENRYEEPGSNSERSDALIPGLDLMGGASYALARHLDVFGDLKYRAVLRNNPRVDHLGLAAGLNYRL